MGKIPDRQMLNNYLLDTCTPAEQRNVERWLQKDPENALTLQKEAKKLRGDKPLPIIEKEQAKASVSQRIDGINTHKHKFKNRKAYSSHTGKQLWARAAAMVLVILTVGVVAFYFGKDYFPEQNQSTKLKKIHVPYGQKGTLNFDDGTVIKLNGGSTIRYPAKFAKNKRVVRLEGEAFFEVTHNESRPFVVQTAHKTIRDLGTAFNVESYKDENLKVAVTEGKVEVTSVEEQAESDKRSIILTKNEWASFQPDGEFLKRGKGNIRPKIAWKEGILIFDQLTFGEVANMLERWYGVKIVLKDIQLKHVLLKGQHEGVSLEEVLNSINFITGIEYTIENGVVTITEDTSEDVL